MIHPLIDQYGSPLRHVTRVPSTVTEIYVRWRGFSHPSKSLTRRQRNERRWLAKHLEFAARAGDITRDKPPRGPAYFFVAADAAQGDQPRGAGDRDPARHADAGGVVERHL